MTRHYQITIRNPAAAVALGATVILVGGALVIVGLTLLAGIVVAGGAVGTGALLLRRLTRGRRASSRLDPAQEVFLPTDQLESSNARRIGQGDQHQP